MHRFTVLLALAIGWLALLSPLSGSLAQTLSREETKKLENARAVLEKIDDAQEGQSENFSALLELREQIEPVRDDIDGIVSALQQRLTSAKAQLAEFGPAPAAGAPAESSQTAAERKAKQALVDEMDTQLRSARALLVQADQLWDELTDARRDLFNSRIFDHQESLLYPGFWRNLLNTGLPDLRRRLQEEMAEISDSITSKQGWSSLLGMAALMLVVTLGMMALDRRLERRRLAAIPVDGAQPTRAAIIRHAATILAMHAVPLLAAALVIWFCVSRFDIAPEDVNTFLLGVAGAGAVYGVANGGAHAVFSPGARRFRIISADDATARRAVSVLNAMMFVYLTGLVLLGIVQAISAQVSLTIAATAFNAAAVVLTGTLLLFRAPAVSGAEAAYGLVKPPLHLLRPIFWILAILIVGALAFGYTALAGFVVGRALATAVILCLAILLYVAIDTIFHDAIAPGKPVNQALSATFGVRPSTIDLIGTIIAGTLRVLTVACTVLVLLSPWGVEFGNLNPFVDVFFGLRFGDLRGWIGTAGIALVLFTVGLLTTRLFVTWLDQQLLPRTALNSGVRHSISTIAGYIGFIVALAVALSQAGVQLQNVALVASALSVGIGFGLQQVVSNFVAGLIVLAERPIRVGDSISVRGEEGKVRKISVRATEILLGENSTLIVPNSEIISSVVKNRSLNDITHRMSLKFVFAHGTDVDAVFQTLQDLARRHENLVQAYEPRLYVGRVFEGGIEVDMHVMCDRIGAMDQMRSDIYTQAMKAFRERGIMLAGAPPLPA